MAKNKRNDDKKQRLGQDALRSGLHGDVGRYTQDVDFSEAFGRMGRGIAGGFSGRDSSDRSLSRERGAFDDMTDDELEESLKNVNLYGDFETGTRAQPGRQVSEQAGHMRLVEDVQGTREGYGMQPGQTTEQTFGEVGGDPFITDLTKEGRQDRGEGPVQFAGETGFTASGDEGATDAQMMEAMGGPPSQDTVDEMTKMARLSNVSSRMAAGDYEDVGAAEFNEAVQKLGETGEMPEVLQEGSAPIVDAFQAAAEERRPGAELPEDAPETAKMTNEMARSMLEQGMSQEEVGQMLGYISPQIKQQQINERMKDVQAMKEEGEYYQTLIEEGEGQGGGEGQGQAGEGTQTPQAYEDVSPSQIQNTNELWTDLRMRAQSEIEDWDAIESEQERNKRVVEWAKKTRPQMLRQLIDGLFIGQGGQQQGAQQQSNLASDIGQALKGMNQG